MGVSTMLRHAIRGAVSYLAQTRDSAPAIIDLSECLQEPRPLIPDLELAAQSREVAASDLIQFISKLRGCAAVNFFGEQEFAPALSTIELENVRR